MPRRSHVNATDPRGFVKFAPAVGPIVADLSRRDVRLRGADARLAGRQVGQLAGCAVQGEFDEPVPIHLLEARRRQLNQLREHGVGVVGRDADRQTDQRSARFTLESSDSSACSSRFSAVRESRSSARRSRWRSLRLRGITTFRTTC
jgi:hypothetical protein